jgi:carboxymethylenebutenolidase
METLTTRWAQLGLTLLFVATCPSAAASKQLSRPRSGELTETTETFKSRGQSVIVDIIAPSATGRYPAVLVLHGHGGLGDGRQSGMHSLARQLAGAGYVALVPHYFGSHKPDRKNGQKNARSFLFWERTVSDAVGFAARRADVDPRRIGLLGASLGSWVALSVGARDRRVSAVVELYGGFPEWEELNPARLPPVLILHGDADRDVPVQQAYHLEEILLQAGVAYEMHIYAGAGHGFRGADHDDAVKRTLEFLDAHVKGVPSGKREGPEKPPAKGT